MTVMMSAIFLPAFVGLAHRLDGFGGERAAPVGYVAGRNRQLVRLLGVVGVLLHPGGDLFAGRLRELLYLCVCTITAYHPRPSYSW